MDRRGSGTAGEPREAEVTTDMASKSPRKSPRKRQGVAVNPTMRGRGPKPGAPNAGRPPNELRAMAAAGLEPFIQRCLRIIRGRNADLAIKAGHALVRTWGSGAR